MKKVIEGLDEDEGVFCTADAIEAPAQNALEVRKAGPRELGERADGGGLYIPNCTEAVTATWF